MRFNDLLHLVAFPGKAHGTPPAPGSVTATKMPESRALSKFSDHFSRYIPLSGVPRGRTGMARPIAGFLVAVMMVAAMALASMAGSGLAQAQAQTDRDIPVDLYNATDGPNWLNNTNWLSDEPLLEWYGVTTDGSGRVTWLDLPSNRLSGEIPAELGGLSNLTYLDLFRNQLTGAVPSELSSLSNLEGLHISDNQLTGAIPSELGGLSNLVDLFLAGNQLTGAIPSELGDLSNLVDLFLAGNQLTGTIPSELAALSVQPGATFPRGQPAERGDTGGTGQPLQPGEVVPQR